MGNSLKGIFKFFTFRLFLNIFLCAAIIIIAAISNDPGKSPLAGKINFFKYFSVFSLLLFTYFNNLYLVPKFIGRRKYWRYILWASLSVILYAVLYVTVIEAALHFYPGIKFYEIVFLSWPIQAKWTVSAVLLSSVGYMFTYAMWTLVMTMAWFMHDHARQQKAMIVAQQKQVETELNFLKSQINPHFLFNTLNNLYALALKKSDNAPDAILKLSTILRYLLYESNTPTVSFDKEKEIMEAYIDLELLRLTDKSNLHFSITADKPYQLPPLLWLPVLENVFKHGTRTIADNSYAEYRFEIKNNLLSIYSKNTDKMLAKSNNETGGIGLSNLRKRLEIMYPKNYSIRSEHENNYYISEVNIELA